MDYTLVLQNPAGKLYTLNCPKNTKICNISSLREWPRLSTEGLVYTIYGENYPADSQVNLGEFGVSTTSITALISYGELIKVSMFGEQVRKRLVIDENTSFRQLKEKYLVMKKLDVDPTKYYVRFNMLKMDDEENVLDSCYPSYSTAYFTISKCA
ncbi:hypothetical protein LPJ77_002254 [Coemansia sp. RSA 2523]|nr:hypothetical protein LPJ54_001754 [Coemansia sp. RSA 1824]KAJ1808581.1 hypothetical protein LPJ77_002254 [Coemansia sp. RSA 2523]KAJ2147395.1 hypothetical protein IW142_001654 [Coemansia sp. RSA 564]KAJ2206854.1 hypothetical protein IW145_001861 [Coemansia sp. RSA 521]KAJ2224148.1 hypothetical protein IW143_000690 [Coemansia sp. RSA 520]KAJ2226319.1 hypothetical protein EV180_002988 [Coemansia sp. RSA 518]KAJ2292293.1 hypothetical protein IW141_002029 [Coemansia sp. RSA 355]KAJ2409266.1 h